MSLDGVQAGYEKSNYTYSAADKAATGNFYSAVACAVQNKKDRSDSEIKGRTTDLYENAIDYHQLFIQKVNELSEKIKNGDTKNSYQTGSRSFTITEWNKLLENFDKIQEVIREIMREEHDKREEKRLEKKELEAEDMSADKLLVSQTTISSYPILNSDSENTEKDITKYSITWYTEEGIFCRKAGQTEGYTWSIAFDNKEQYYKVINFIDRFDKDENLSFASNEDFWRDFLADEIDIEGFTQFFGETGNGTMNYLKITDESVYVDTQKVKYAMYINPTVFNMYSADEFFEMQMKLIAANTEKLPKFKE